MARKIIILVWSILVGVPAFSSFAQFSTNPVESVYEMRTPVFCDGQDQTPELANFRLHLVYRLTPGHEAALMVGDTVTIDLPAADTGATLELRYEHTATNPALVSASVGHQTLLDGYRVPGSDTGGTDRSTAPEVAEGSRLDGDSPAPVSTFATGVPGFPVSLRLAGDDGLRMEDGWVQPLGPVDHAEIIGHWDENSLRRGADIYQQLCVTCHGTAESPGSLPTALKFHQGPFRNGSDPYRMFRTLSDGFGMMVPQPQYSAEDKYAVIQYIREALVQPHNPDQLYPIEAGYLQALPRPMAHVEPEQPAALGMRDIYQHMDYGPYLMWTYQVDRGTPTPEANIAYKGIAVRLDPGPGGVSRGRAWMVYDHDTLRVAAASSGDAFVDWKGIAFDGSHGTHTSLAGELAFANPVGPGWAHPKTGQWEDPRPRFRDGKPYGPLPRDWAHYQGIYLHGDQVVLAYSVGAADILESPGLIDYGVIQVFRRTISVGPSPHPLALRVAPADGVVVSLLGSDAGRLRQENGFHVLRLPPATARESFTIFVARTASRDTVDALVTGHEVPDLTAWTRGGPRRWPDTVTTRAEIAPDDGAFAVDVLTVPDHTVNPWQSWMRLGGFDFFADGESAAICTWNGDVWIVDGVTSDSGLLHWQRVATGLFQPLGLMIADEIIHVTCRDQIARLHDLNGDREIDYVENFNNDHQVTEHFHEFAMGLQQDAAGNWYYAKSARHALPAVVPHHGTLLRVSPDGSRTDIVATGFRAANGVCINPDGTWLVTDQEGHWTPGNRINYVREAGFYGNMLGYHDVTDAGDDAMEQPLCWITKQMDRSPAELCWVPDDAAWGPLVSTLLNTSYGYGKLYVVPHEFIDGLAQGGVCSLPLPPFDTGVMRARFHPVTGQLYGLGLFAWSGNQQAPGGFYRIRYTGLPAYLPVGLRATTQGMEITFSDPLAPETGRDPDDFRVRTWSLKRTEKYGSKPHDDRNLEVREATMSADRRTVFLSIPDLRPTWCMEIACRLIGADGEPVERVIHNTIHRLGPPPDRVE